MSIDPRNIEVIDDATAAMLRTRTGGQTLRKSLAMFTFARDMTLQSVRDQYPQWSESEVRAEAQRRLHGE